MKRPFHGEGGGQMWSTVSCKSGKSEAREFNMATKSITIIPFFHENDSKWNFSNRVHSQKPGTTVGDMVFPFRIAWIAMDCKENETKMARGGGRGCRKCE